MDINCKKSIIDSLYEKYRDDLGMWSVHLDDMSSEELPFDIEDWMYDYAMKKQKDNIINECDMVVSINDEACKVREVTSVDGEFAELDGFIVAHIGTLRKVKKGS